MDYHHGACEDTWLTALDQANAWGMPIFANLDPFGPGVPNGLVQHILVDALTAHKRMFDVAGHYARAAVVRLVVDRRAKPTATFIDDTDLASVAATDANTPEPTMN